MQKFKIELPLMVEVEVNDSVTPNGLDTAIRRYMIPQIEWAVEEKFRLQNIDTTAHAKINSDLLVVRTETTFAP